MDLGKLVLAQALDGWDAADTSTDADVYNEDTHTAPSSYQIELENNDVGAAGADLSNAAPGYTTEPERAAFRSAPAVVDYGNNKLGLVTQARALRKRKRQRLLLGGGVLLLLLSVVLGVVFGINGTGPSPAAETLSPEESAEDVAMAYNLSRALGLPAASAGLPGNRSSSTGVSLDCGVLQLEARSCALMLDSFGAPAVVLFNVCLSQTGASW